VVKLLIFLHYFVAGVYIAYGIVSWCYFSVAFSGERLADDAAQAVALHALGRHLFTVSPALFPYPLAYLSVALLCRRDPPR